MARLAEAELVALVARRQASLDALAAELPGVPGWTDLEQAIRESEAEAWVVACTTKAGEPDDDQVSARVFRACGFRLRVGQDVAELAAGEDACRVSLGQTPQVLATLNNTVLALVDRLRLPNLAAAIRTFAAQPAKALALLLSPF